jgi:hypothetical protein
MEIWDLKRSTIEHLVLIICFVFNLHGYNSDLIVTIEETRKFRLKLTVG